MHLLLLLGDPCLVFLLVIALASSKGELRRDSKHGREVCFGDLCAWIDLGLLSLETHILAMVWSYHTSLGLHFFG